MVLQGPKHFSGGDLRFQRSLSQEQSRGQCRGRESREDPAVPSASQLIPTSLPRPLLPSPPTTSTPSALRDIWPLPHCSGGHSNSLCVDTQCRAISAHSSGPVIGEGQFKGSHRLPKPHPRDGTCMYPLFSVPRSGEGSTLLPLL